MQVHRTDYGFRYAAIRRPITNAAQTDYVRSTVFVAPGTVLIPPNNLYNVANVNVPMDDTNSVFYFIAWGTAPRHQTPKPGANSLAPVSARILTISTARCVTWTTGSGRIAKR